jgi:hypothetical protein
MAEQGDRLGLDSAAKGSQAHQTGEFGHTVWIRRSPWRGVPLLDPGQDGALDDGDHQAEGDGVSRWRGQGRSTQEIETSTTMADLEEPPGDHAAAGLGAGHVMLSRMRRFNAGERVALGEPT